MGCTCKSVRVGSYDNQVTVNAPKNIELRRNTPERELRKSVSLDACIAEEVMDLWALGIITTGCCCGHGYKQSYIGVSFGHIFKMKELGYKVALNSCRPDDEDSFIPTTI